MLKELKELQRKSISIDTMGCFIQPDMVEILHLLQKHDNTIVTLIKIIEYHGLKDEEDAGVILEHLENFYEHQNQY